MSTEPATSLEAELLRDVQKQLDRWTSECAGQPESERKKLLLLALEREQIVAVAYREEAVAGRVAELPVGDEIRALFHQTLVWIWKDEQMHAEYLRGELLKRGVWVLGRGLRTSDSGCDIRVDFGHLQSPPSP